MVRHDSRNSPPLVGCRKSDEAMPTRVEKRRFGEGRKAYSATLFGDFPRYLNKSDAYHRHPRNALRCRGGPTYVGTNPTCRFSRCCDPFRSAAAIDEWRCAAAARSFQQGIDAEFWQWLTQLGLTRVKSNAAKITRPPSRAA